MGPIVLFDKSFLQSLSLDEAVWFDNFFLTNICPIFFVETLADLSKTLAPGRSPEKEVGVIAGKTPEMHSHLNPFHSGLCLASLLGHRVPMTGQLLLGTGKPVRSGDRRGVVYEVSPEARALARWQHGDFEEVEREFAGAWRNAVTQLSLHNAVRRVTALRVHLPQQKTLADAKSASESVLSSSAGNFEVFEVALSSFGVSSEHRQEVLARWSRCGHTSLRDFAPYAAHVFAVDTFFCIAAASNLVSLEDQVDNAYLYYLPFCMIFTSSDRYHKRCAPLFMRGNQRFVWGPELKADLGKLDSYYDRLPDQTKEKGLYSFALRPPTDGDFLVSKLWGEFLPGWRRPTARRRLQTDGDVRDTIKWARDLVHAPSVPNETGDPTGTDPVVFQRRVRKKRGKWYQLDKNLKTTRER